MLLQIIVVELVIELLRIATIHTPNHLSSAMGLIATLILGQMAVDIGLFQSEILLYCSISSIGGFATPSYELSLANKLVKAYIETIAGQWKRNGIETASEAMDLAKKEHGKKCKINSKKKECVTPEWFNENIKSDNIEQEEDNEFKSILEEFRK